MRGDCLDGVNSPREEEVTCRAGGLWPMREGGNESWGVG